MMVTQLKWFCGFLFILVGSVAAGDHSPLPGTQPLTWDDDLASRMVDGIDRFLLREIEQAREQRDRHWQRDFTSPAALRESVKSQRDRLAHILGVRDPRVPFQAFEYIATTRQPALVGQGEDYDIFAVRWPVIGGIYGEGLLLVPAQAPIADIIAMGHCDHTPEMMVGLAPGIPPQDQFARKLARAGCRVVIPTLINREMKRRAPPGMNGRANLTNREYVYRSAFEMGRHIIGYEIQKVLAAVDLFERQSAGDPKIGVVGWGEGGMLALYAAALDERIDAVHSSGYFGKREHLWRQPLDRNVFGLLEQFGDAEAASLIYPRLLVLEQSDQPEFSLPSEGGGPSDWHAPDDETGKRAWHDTRRQEWNDEVNRLKRLLPHDNWLVPLSLDGNAGRNYGDVRPLLAKLSPQPVDVQRNAGPLPTKLIQDFDPAPRQQRQLQQMDAFNQSLLHESPYVRAAYMQHLDTTSIEKYNASVRSYREQFRDQIIGRFANESLPFHARSRRAYDEPKWTGYEVVLDVFHDVFAYGILLLPKDLQAGERRPVVVCQHGLEGRPQDTVTGDHRAYHDFAAKLAERGFITFAPQNPYIFQDRFRTLQRKANPLGRTLFSVIVPQHQQIVDWLGTLPHVDPDRIAFYGLSYGGKTAMRVPALVENYCLSICSADFNDWIWKNASTRSPYSYVWTGEYEIFEFDLGNTFNYSEMAALIAPRPFMVERGHFDGVAPDERVALEFAKVRHLYNARLKIGDRAEIEWFPGPHTIHGQATFKFLHKQLGVDSDE